MNYPEDFTADQQAIVEAEKILANEAFVKARRFIGSEFQSEDKLKELIRQYVARLMLAFARQACELGRIRAWTVSHIDVTVKWFVYQIASEAQSEKTYFHDGTDARHISLIYGREVTQKEMHHIRASGEWEEYQKLLLEVANIQKISVALESSEFEDDDGAVIDEALLKKTVDLLESIAETEGAVDAPTSSREEEVSRRHQLLEEYKAATDRPSNRRIYNARNSGIHKPEFLKWQRGDLPSSSATCQNFERFLKQKKAPTPRDPKVS